MYLMDNLLLSIFFSFFYNSFYFFFFFFFSSRRRPTGFDCDWSSDVCSSDLDAVRGIGSESVVELEAKPGEPPAVHRAKHDLALQGPEQRQVIDDVGRAQDAIDTGPFQGDQQIGRGSGRERG